MSIFKRIEDFFYLRILRPILFYSRLARRSMFGYADTGVNFDYIYENRASGYTWVGKFIDRILLNLPAAKATRARKQSLVEIIRNEIASNMKKGIKTRIVDLASGPARYLIEALTNETAQYVEVLCLDLDHHSVRRGRLLARNLPVLYKRGNALRISKLKRISERRAWRPNLVVMSGFYEYLSDAAVESHLKEVYHQMDVNGKVVFVCQVSNPSKKLIEKLGKTSRGSSWKLFYRKKEAAIALAENAGFTDLNAQIDQWNMYLVCVGVRRNSISEHVGIHEEDHSFR